jgi:glycosyltransferase involved in cell wall biosynthesis
MVLSTVAAPPAAPGMFPPPLTDIAIPTCGRTEYLVYAIESVLAQEPGDWRLTVSEDGRGSAAVAAAVAPYLRDRRVRYVATGRRLGAARHMSRLIHTGAAPYVALLHDDDRWAPGFLARRLEFLEDHPACAFAFSGVKVIDEAGRELRQMRPRLRPGVQRPDAFAPRMLRRNLVPNPSVLVRRRAYDAVGMAYDERFPHVYDYEMWLRLAVRFPVGYLTDVDAAWRNHGSQSSFEGRRRGEELLAFLGHAEALIRRDLPHVRISSARRRYVHGRRLLTAALDAVELEQPRAASIYLARALRAYPLLAMNPRLAAALLGLAAGRSGRETLGTTRLHARRRHVRIPF